MVCIQDYEKILVGKTPHVLIDVRQPVELEICSLPNAISKETFSKIAFFVNT